MYTQLVQFQYQPLANVPNSVIELPNNYNNYFIFEADALLAQLVSVVRRSRPGWKYKAKLPAGACVRENTVRVERLTVFDGDERIGDIWLSEAHSRSFRTYCVANQRIDRALARKRHQETTKLQVAAKHMIKSFYAKTLDELASETARPANMQVSQVTNVLVNSNIHRLQELSKVTMDFALAHDAEFFATLTEPQRVEYGAVKAFRAAEADISKFSNSNRYVFIDRGGGKFIRALITPHNYIVATDEVTLDQLPDPIKLSLSILKLQDYDKLRFVAGHGFRVSETTFVVGV